MERIAGNDGVEKYLVVAKNGNVALGIYLRASPDCHRPLVGEGHPISICGRIRVAAAPGAEASESEINGAFKGLPIEKFAMDSQLRASCSVGIFLNQIEKAALPASIDAQQVGFKLFDWLTKHFESSLMTVTASELHDIVKAEILSTSDVDETGTIEIAKKIAAQDADFSPSLDSVLAQLEIAHNEALEVLREAHDKAFREANAVTQVLVDEYMKVNPAFSFSLPEATQFDFDLMTLIYADLIDCDDGYGDDGEYDA